MKKIIYSLEDVPKVTKQLIALMPQCSVFTFTGPLGAGKTSLVREILRLLGVHGPIASPTFTYVNQYTTANGQTIYHFDLYRIVNQDDFIAAGFDEYLYQPNSWVFIEWPEPVMALLDQKVCNIKIDYNNDKRTLEIDIV
jgi:tRNA threonylcarbamoyladenosine biosynthesis protein TsaE